MHIFLLSHLVLVARCAMGDMNSFEDVFRHLLGNQSTSSSHGLQHNLPKLWMVPPELICKRGFFIVRTLYYKNNIEPPEAEVQLVLFTAGGGRQFYGH
jgi:hypothetical protein